MLKRYWEIIVYFPDQDPRTFHLEYDKYPMEVIITVADIVMIKHGASDYKIDEVWKKEDS